MADDNFFNLHDLAQGIHRVLCDGIETRIFPGDQAMLSVVRAEPNAQGSIHVKVGDFWRSPGGVEHGFKAGPEGAVILDIFSPPRDEYKKAGAGFSG